MNGNELIEKMNDITNEQRESLREFLNDGRGHTVAPIDFFTDMGIPEEFLEPMVNRNWSNFVQIPKGVVKVALDCITDRPIGFVDGEKYDSSGNIKRGWKLLLTPKEQEKGYLESDSYYGITKSRIKTLWLEETGEDEFDESNWEDYVKEHGLNPRAQYWSHRWEQGYEYEEGITSVQYKVPVSPSRQNWGDREEITTEIKEGNGHFLIKYDGTKRIDWINGNKVAFHKHQASKKPVTLKVAEAWVRGKIEDNAKDDTPFGSGRLHSVGDIRFSKKEGEGYRPIKDIARDYWQDSRDTIDYHKRMVEKAVERCSGILEFIKETDNVPLGWVHEQLEPMGYMDVMWNNGFMTPWVDGISCSTVITAMKNALGVEKSSTSFGRGSSARENAGYLKECLEEMGVLAQ